MLGHLNVNSLWNKFVSIADVIQRIFDVLLLSEIKIDKRLLPGKQFA